MVVPLFKNKTHPGFGFLLPAVQRLGRRIDPLATDVILARIARGQNQVPAVSAFLFGVSDHYFIRFTAYYPVPRTSFALQIRGLILYQLAKKFAMASRIYWLPGFIHGKHMTVLDGMNRINRMIILCRHKLRI